MALQKGTRVEMVRSYEPSDPSQGNHNAWVVVRARRDHLYDVESFDGERRRGQRPALFRIVTPGIMELAVNRVKHLDPDAPNHPLQRQSRMTEEAEALQAVWFQFCALVCKEARAGKVGSCAAAPRR